MRASDRSILLALATAVLSCSGGREDGRLTATHVVRWEGASQTIQTQRLVPPERGGSVRVSEHDAAKRATAREDPAQEAERLAHHEAQVLVQMTIPGAIDAYRKKRGAWPASLDALVEEDMLKETEIIDPWGGQIVYSCRSRGAGLEALLWYAVVSKGPDRELGTRDDTGIKWVLAPGPMDLPAEE